MWLAIPLVVLIVALVYEYRLRRPDQLILFEADGAIGFRKARWYPRHFSLALPGTTHPIEMKLEASAKGSMAVIVRLTVTVAASKERIGALVRVGGWNTGAVPKAAKELETVLQGQVKQYAEKHGLEELTSEGLRDFLMERDELTRKNFGLDIVSLTVLSIDPVDASIAEALRQQESARILEQTEVLNQRARVAAAQARLKADDQITCYEHDLELKKLDLRKVEQEREAILARQRVEEELQRSRLKLEYDREEMGLLKENPQLLLLTPQAARLAEASQTMKNARTVVSLSPGEADQGARLLGLFQLLIENVLNGSAKHSDRNQG